MIFNSGWSKNDIESLTYLELFRYVEIFYQMQSEMFFNFFKAFCIYNFESTAVAFSSNKADMKRYWNDVKNRKIPSNNSNHDQYPDDIG